MIITHADDDELNPYNPFNVADLGWAPLPEEVYPRKVPAKRDIGNGYYVAMALVLSVWMITPLSW